MGGGPLCDVDEVGSVMSLENEGDSIMDDWEDIVPGSETNEFILQSSLAAEKLVSNEAHTSDELRALDNEENLKDVSLNGEAHPDGEETAKDASSSGEAHATTLLNGVESSKGETVNGDATTKASTPLKDSRQLFKLITIKSDKQELSFVEKVVLSKEEILELCTRINPGFIRVPNGESGRWLLDLPLLRNSTLQTVGFYGNKRVMLELFSRENLLSSGNLELFRNQKMEPGLYGSLVENNKKLVLFYWHPAEKFSSARRSDVSCTFIRYLVELCEIIYSCVEVENGDAPVVSSSATGLKRKRTHRLQISLVKSSENDFIIKPGFKLEELVKGSCSFPESFKLNNGFHRSAMVFSERYSPKEEFRPTTERRSASGIPELVKEWGDVKLSFDRLPDEEFILFAHYAGLQGGDELVQALEALEMETREKAKQLENVEEYVGRKKLECLQGFARGLSAYLRLTRPWEEKLLSNSSSVKVSPLSGTTLNDFRAFFELSEGEDDEQVMNEIETKLVEGIRGAGFEDHLVFIGSRVRVNRFPEVFTIEAAGSDERRTGPILYNEELIISSGDELLKIKLKNEGRVPVLVKDSFTLELHTGKFYRGVSEIIEVMKGVEFEVVNPGSGNSLRCWLDTLAADAPKVENKARLASKMISNKGDLKIDDSYLTSCVLADALDDIPPELKKFLSGDDQQELDENIPEVVISECLDFYRDGRSVFLSKFFGFLKTSFFARLKPGVKLELARSFEELQRFRGSEITRLVDQLKMKLRENDSEDERLIVEMEKFELVEVSVGSRVKSFFTSLQLREAKEVRIKFRKQELPRERIIWRAIEFAPRKKDMDSLVSNKDHLFVPERSRVQTLADIDASSRLIKLHHLKSGQVLIFVELEESELLIYLTTSLGAGLRIPESSPIRRVKRGTDLFAFDEASKFIAFYSRMNSTIRVHRFDDSFREMAWTLTEFHLGEYHGSRNITWMEFVPGRGELLAMDDELRVQVFEVGNAGMMKPGVIELPESTMRVCVSADGLCLISVCGAEDESGEKLELSAAVFRLDDSMAHIRTSGMNLSVEKKNRESFQVSVVMFGSQMHLLVSEDGNSMRSVALGVTVASQSCQLQTRRNPSSEVINSEDSSSCHELEYLYHIFDKYSTSPPLRGSSSTRELHFRLVFRVLAGEEAGVGDALTGHSHSLLMKLSREKGKDLSGLSIGFSSEALENFSVVEASGTNMVSFLRKLMTLVPVQIARAENNSLKPLIDGLEMTSEVNYVDSISLAGILRFGLYEAVLESWNGPIKVISSMGKQSSGKSYLLNHLSGSLLDVAGGRCTDGVWMTACVSDEVLYVILDFEGLGSFERSEQEDMLLSIMNAAVSNITIFNKKDFHLDKETEAVFERFQNGVSLVKQDEKLFRGLFYMAIKDVDAADVDDLRDEFYSKISHICNKSQENFLTKMYGGDVEIAAMPPFNRSEFHESIGEIAQTVEELPVVHSNGKSFLRDLKLVIAQISSKDWSPIDTKRIGFKVSMLRKNLEVATALGSLGGEKLLVNFDTEEEIEDHPVTLSGLSFDLRDTGLQLTRYKDMDGFSTVLDHLQLEFERVNPRTGKLDEEWHLCFEEFLGGLAERRKSRVLDWINVNTGEFAGDGDVQKLVLEATTMLAGVKDYLALCSCKCQHCFLRCVLQKSHQGVHSCNGSHECSEVCSFCVELEGPGAAARCSDASGHSGDHDCKLRSHTCGAECGLQGVSSNCNRSCAMKIAHPGDHRCNSKQHMCRFECSLPGCSNTCVSPVEIDHKLHACHEKMCPESCTMQGCNRKCSSDDHFHSRKLGVGDDDHFCGDEHQCFHRCDSVGNCEVLTEVVKKTKTFVGKRSTFEYEHVSEQNGVKKGCCIPIPAFARTHPGTHRHSRNPLVIHFCQSRCEGCGYFCNLPVGHFGLHDTTHGNMTSKTFVSETEEVDILDRKYSWGESGAAEMCMMHCKARGRGHLHLGICRGSSGHRGICAKLTISEGARHETKKYGPEFNIAKDEFTHSAYWKNMRFKDPCSVEDQREFRLCNHSCKSADHQGSGAPGSNAQKVSHCLEELWHAPVARSQVQSFAGNGGYVTEDGHRFACNHSRDRANHVIFVIDMSSSMGCADIRPSLVKFQQNRLGCVYDAMVRFIRTRLSTTIDDSMSVVLFNNGAFVGMERLPLAEHQVDLLLRFVASGSTTYSGGLRLAEEILGRSMLDPLVMNKAPAVIFLSDGGNNGGSDPVGCVRSLKAVEPRVVVHTIMFGSDPSKQVLIDMAKAGGGVFQVSLDELQLARTFEGLAHSLVPKVASLI